MLEFGQDIGIDLGTATVIAYVKGKGIVTTKSNSNVWKKYEYNIPDKTSVNTIDILFSHADYLTGSARGYFYIAEEECI